MCTSCARQLLNSSMVSLPSPSPVRAFILSLSVRVPYCDVLPRIDSGAVWSEHRTFTCLEGLTAYHRTPYSSLYLALEETASERFCLSPSELVQHALRIVMLSYKSTGVPIGRHPLVL